MDFLTIFSRFIREQELLSKEEDRVLLAVSGGKDSIMLTHLFAQSSIQFAIAHCNFQLRGEQANSDAQFVNELASNLGVPYYETVFDTTCYAHEKKISIQMAARELRYDWLEEIRINHHYQYIAVGHHQTDSVETVLINMVRGTGIAGLHGILPKRERIIRPLLAFTGDEVAHFVTVNSIQFCEDHTNQETTYSRNKIRLKVLPVLKEINPTLEKTFSTSSRRFYELELFLDKQINNLREELFVEIERNVFEIEIALLKEHSQDSFVLYELFQKYGFTEEVLQDLVTTLENPHTGILFHSSSHQILVNRDKLILEQKKVGCEKRVPIHELPFSFTWYGANYRIYFSEEIPMDLKSKDGGNKIVVDAENIMLPIEVRSWEEGDFFYPLGLGGKKKISDFLIDKKVALNKKQEVPILINSNGEILAVSLKRIDERYKVNRETKKVIILEQLYDKP